MTRRSLSVGVLALVIALAAVPAIAQVRVNPAGVNVSGQNATTVFLTFGSLGGYRPAEALWCGDLVPATPDIGSRCDPATLYGSLPARYDLSQLSGLDAYTDIMSVPASVARRAYQAAVAGRSAEFFYVRRFVRAAFRDQYVAVTLRLTGGGARVPLSLVDVQLAFAVETPVLYVEAGNPLPSVSARIVYTGTGRLQGRWEVVLPGQPVPTAVDLLTDATLPVEKRTGAARYPEVGRFNVFLDPTGRFTLKGPDPATLPTGTAGQYLLLLRVEATDDGEGDSDLSAVGAGSGIVHAGGVAGFPMPVLRYVVGSNGSDLLPGDPKALAGDRLVVDGGVTSAGAPVDLTWASVPQAAYYRVEIEGRSSGQLVHQALMAMGTTTYRLPPFAVERAGDALRWRVVAVDAAGRDAAASPWRVIRIGS